MKVGVGKSTLVKFIIDALDLDPENDVAFVAFTGKASEVLRNKGNPNAQTAHKLLYKARQMSNGKFYYKKLDSIPYKVIVVDEVSMLSKEMWDLLLSHKKHVIALGDPAQLPPISKKDDNHVLDNPHIFLDEVMRQAQESDIIRLSMDVRAGKKLSPFKGHDVNVVRRKDLCDGMYFWADQILCATNRTRAEINNYIREAKNFGFDPKIGDKIICLNNSWSIESLVHKNPLVNGTIGYIKDMNLREFKYYIAGQRITAPVLLTSIETDSDIYTDIPIDYTSLITGEKFFTSKQEYAIRKNKINKMSLPIEFNWGYGITVHKFQGSEANKILYLEESFPFDKETHQRHLYTGLTRASEKLTLVLKS